MSEKQVSVRLVVKDGEIVRAQFKGLGEAGEQSFRTMSDGADGLTGRLGRLAGPAGLGAVAKAAAAAAAAFASVGETIRVISEFDRGMSELAAVTRASAFEMEALRDVAKDLGSTTEFTARQAADGLTFLARAGFDAAEAMAAIPAVLDLATASGMELGRAADIASNIMSGFGIAAEEAASVTDILAAASSRANTDVAQLGSAMSTVAPISAALGVSLEDTAAAIGVMSDAGIQGERAGTALRGVLSSLAGPTTQAQQALANYGLTAQDVNPEVNSLAEIMDLLSERGLSTADAMQIFGREAASGALVMIESADRLRSFGDELQNVDGAAANMAATMRDNLAGDFNSAMSAAQGLMIAIGEAGLTTILRTAVQVLTGLVRSISSIIELMTDLAQEASTAARALLGLGTDSRTTALAIGEVETAINGEVRALLDLVGEIPSGMVMSREMANAKLDQAEAHLATVAAMQEEARQLVLQSAEYRNAQAEVSRIKRAIDQSLESSFNQTTLGLLPAETEALVAVLFEAQKQQEALLEATEQVSPEYAEAIRNVETLRAAIANAVGDTVTLGETAGEAAEQFRLADAASQVSSSIGGALRSAFFSLVPSFGGEETPAPSRSGTGSGGRARAASAAERQAEAIDRVMQSLSDEIAMIAMSDEARRTHDALRQAGVDIYSAEGQAIAEQVEQLMALEAQLERNASATQAIENSARNAFASFVTGAQSAREAAAGLLSSLADMAANAAFNTLIGGGFGGGGAFGALAGAIFGSGGGAAVPSFDGGGQTKAGPRSGGLDGRGGFLAMLHPDETVIDHTKGQAIAPSITISIDARGAVDGVAEQVNQQIRAALPEISRTVVSAVSDGQRRGRS